MDRVFLIGDAGHIHTPAGGQGLNTGITDAHNLAWKLALVWHGRTGAELLDSYADERGQVAKAVVQQADVQMRIWLLRKRYQVTLRDSVLRLASALRLFDLAYIPWLAGLRTKYRPTPGVGRKTGGYRSGTLVPLPLPLPLRSELDDLRYTLLFPRSERPEVRALWERCRTELADVVDARMLDRRGRGLLVLARPDVYVDRVSQQAGPIDARLTELFRPLLTANESFRRKIEVRS